MGPHVHLIFQKKKMQLQGVHYCVFCYPGNLSPSKSGAALAAEYTSHCFEHRPRTKTVAPTKASYDLIIAASRRALKMIEENTKENGPLGAAVVKMMLEAQERKPFYDDVPQVDIEMGEDSMTIHVKRSKPN